MPIRKFLFEFVNVGGNPPPLTNVLPSFDEEFGMEIERYLPSNSSTPDAKYVAALTISRQRKARRGEGFAATLSNLEKQWETVFPDHDIWSDLVSEANFFAEDYDISTLPLWLAKNPLETQWLVARAKWLRAGEPWSQCADWYDGLLRGRPTDWSAIVKIPFLESAAWKGDDGPEKIEADIETFRLPAALKATANGERISVNEQTQKFFAEPVTDIPRDHLEDVLAKIAEAVALFPTDDESSNQHRALVSEVKILDKALDSYAQRPRMLFSSVSRVLRRLNKKIASGECPDPEQDADLDDFMRLVMDAQTTLLENDPLVREAVSGGLSKHLPNLSVETQDVIIAAADEVSNVSEGDLKEELPEQARTISDPMASDIERREAFISTAGRLLRVYVMTSYKGSKKALEEIESISKTMAGIAKNASVLAAFGTAVWHGSPLLKKAVDLLLSAL